MKISIITAAYNKADCVKDAIESVLNQDYDDVEYIVVEGQSTDNTLDEIKKFIDKSGYKHRLTADHVISGRDNGLYDALNKGIRMATGDYIGFVHSDDMFFDNGVVSKIVRSIEENNGCDILYANGKYVCAQKVSCVVRDWVGGTYERNKLKWGWLPLHPTVYIKRDVYMNHGLYDTSYKIAGDTDLLVRLFGRDDLKICWMDDYVIRMRVGGLSTSPWNTGKKWKEDMRLYKTYGYPVWLVCPCKILRKIPQYVTEGGFYIYVIKRIWNKICRRK